MKKRFIIIALAVLALAGISMLFILCPPGRSKPKSSIKQVSAPSATKEMVIPVADGIKPLPFTPVLLPLDERGRIKPHIITDETEARYLVDNLDKSPIYPNILKSFYFYRDVPKQWDKKQAIELLNKEMLKLKPGESRRWFLLAGVEAYARRYVQNVPNAGPSYANIFKYSEQLAKIDPDLFRQLLREMTYNETSRDRTRHPHFVSDLGTTMLELLPAYLTMPKLYNPEPELPTVPWRDLQPILDKLDKQQRNNFSYLYRSALLEIPLREADVRASMVTYHPEFINQPTDIKRQFYLNMSMKYAVSDEIKQVKWLAIAVESTGAGYSHLLNYYYSRLSKTASLSQRHLQLEKQFATAIASNSDNAANSKTVAKFLDPKIKSEIESLYAASDSSQYDGLRSKLKKDFPTMPIALEYLELLNLKAMASQRQCLINQYQPIFDNLLEKALKDYSRPQDVMEIFEFVNEKMKLEDKAYAFLDDFTASKPAASEMNLRAVYVLAKYYAKQDKTRALSVIDRINYSQYDIDNGGAIAFRVRLLKSYESRLRQGLTPSKT